MGMSPSPSWSLKMQRHCCSRPVSEGITIRMSIGIIMSIGMASEWHRNESALRRLLGRPSFGLGDIVRPPCGGFESQHGGERSDLGHDALRRSE